MNTTAKTRKLPYGTLSCLTALLLAACGGGGGGGAGGGSGGGGSGSGGSVTTYSVNVSSGSGGSVSPSSATVTGGASATFTVTPNGSYAIGAVSGCGGTLSGSTYTTGTITSNCAVTASFDPAFTWVAGPDTTLVVANYGTQGVAAASNQPPPREKAVAWTDKKGNFWMFGGYGFDANAVAGGLNDLWEYSPASGQWTWINGTTTANSAGVYGAQNVAAATNVPGGRWGSASWTDANGNLWLLGGWNNSGPNQHWNDLWEFLPSIGQWAWVGGSNVANAAGVYGVQGVAAPGNSPGGRTYAAHWVDASGNFWLYGGEGIDIAGSYGWLSDLWQYSPSSGQWTWISGADTTQATAVYGTQGVAAAANTPGLRAFAATWTDASGNLWLFGGNGFDYTTYTMFDFNDLWKYSPSSGQWTWVSGSSTVNATAVYGTQGVASAASVPGARVAGPAWTDSSGNLWLFGAGHDHADGISADFFNDLWKFSPSSGQWTWVAGSSAENGAGVYGTQGVAAVANLPGARTTPASWTDGSNLWFYGGNGYDSAGTYGDMGDLWKYPIQ